MVSRHHAIATLLILGAIPSLAYARDLHKSAAVPKPLAQEIHLDEGQAVTISARIDKPSALPDNGRLKASWTLIRADDPKQFSDQPKAKPARKIDAEGIYTRPTPNWSKLLHALDPDVFTVYRAPISGTYQLEVSTEPGEVTLFDGGRWREKGQAPFSRPASKKVSWPANRSVGVTIEIRDIDARPAGDRLFIEAEPNDTPEQAQPLSLRAIAEDYSLRVVGGSDDIEYYDNSRVGGSGDDWFRLEFPGKEPRLLTACLSIPDQIIAARIRCYTLPADRSTTSPGGLLPLKGEYTEGKNANERVHQQKEQHRIAINRKLKPGQVYFLRVESNSPGYELDLQIIRPAPFTDPRQAVRQGLYDHVGQVDSWLANRPRGASVERRIRDTGNLLGTQCMSCHTQSGVWGPAIPLTQGYRIRNIQLFRNLVNICYQSMRPTNKLIDAANNTSLAPLDLGDGPAGTRVAGHSVVSIERYRAPRVLQSKQAIRAANFVLQSGDPGGINAAGPGANVGKSVVFSYAGEVLYEAWKATGDPKYFRGLEEKVRKVLDVKPAYTDDMAHRVELLKRYFPADYPAVARQVADRETKQPQATSKVPYKGHKTTPAEADQLAQRIEKQVTADLGRLRQIQNANGTWGFSPGKSSDGGKTWKAEGNIAPEPSPTALALIAFQAAGFTPDDATVKKGVQGLLQLQHPSGYWKGKSQTGFVSTAYSLHALSRLFPVDPPKPAAKDFAATPGETLAETIDRARRLSTTEDQNRVPMILTLAGHDSPLVRYWGMIGLAAAPADAGVVALARGLGDPVKAVREAAAWGLRQLLIDNRGWKAVATAAGSADDRTRGSLARALVMRVDGVMPGIGIEWNQLTAMISAMMLEDPHPAVRAWATRASWNWWVWNPPVRTALNQAWIKRLSQPEPNELAENGLRYQAHALFVANGHKANGSRQHQYTKLDELFLDIDGKLEDALESDPTLARRLARRLVAVAATYYNTSGGDGGPGQMGYITPSSGDLFGHAVLAYLDIVDPDLKKDRAGNSLLPVRIGLEGAANVPHQPLQQQLIEYSLEGPEALRAVAASSVSDPRSAKFVAVPELVEPLLRQIRRGANEPPRRAQLSDPVLKLFGRVRWVIPQNKDQQHEVLGYLVPKFSEFLSAEEIKKNPDAAKRTELGRQMDAQWYLATGLGDALGRNPDLHIDMALDFLPKTLKNKLDAQFWLPSVTWILTHKTKLPEVQVKKGQLPPLDPYAAHRTRALQLFLDQLKATADLRTRSVAVTMAQATALRRNPEVLNALEAMLKFEKREKVVKAARNVLSTNRKNFLKELTTAVNREKPRKQPADKDGKPKLDAEFVADFQFFRDYVTPEMNKVLRGDQRSCYACHGVPGRVPPLTLNRPDDAGYLPVDKMLANYRLLQARVELGNIEKSKLLRKPLNVQTGKEDGHQGGRRYKPMDPGYQIIRRWVLNQKKHPAKLGLQTSDTSAPKPSTRQQ